MTVYRSTLDPETHRGELRRTSPEVVPAVTSNGSAKASSSLLAVVKLLVYAKPPMRTSPKRLSLCGRPGVPKACPPSATNPKFRFASTAQVWKARRIWRCQAAVGCRALRVEKRVLDWPADWVPSGAKLMVRCCASGQGLPQVVGTQRSSRHSTERREWRSTCTSVCTWGGLYARGERVGR